jgi:hypothetical protein
MFLRAKAGQSTARPDLGTSRRLVDQALHEGLKDLRAAKTEEMNSPVTQLGTVREELNICVNNWRHRMS